MCCTSWFSDDMQFKARVVDLQFMRLFGSWKLNWMDRSVVCWSNKPELSWSILLFVGVDRHRPWEVRGERTNVRRKRHFAIIRLKRMTLVSLASIHSMTTWISIIWKPPGDASMFETSGLSSVSVDRFLRCAHSISKQTARTQFEQHAAFELIIHMWW